MKPNYKAIVDAAIGEKPSLVKDDIIKAVREQSRFVTLGVDGPVRIRTTRINNDKQDTKKPTPATNPPQGNEVHTKEL